MNKIRFSIAVATIVVLLFVSIFGLGQILSPADAQAQEEVPGTITVVGEGIVRIKPDIAQATVGVEVVKPTVREATDEVSQVMDAVVETLKEQGISDKDIQTSNFSVWTDYSYGPDDTQRETTYRVSNQVNITIRDLDSVGDVLDAAIEAGANNIYGVTFSLDDPTQLESEAREKAVENARAEAEELAELTGLQLGRVVSVSEVIGTSGYYGANVRAASEMGMGGGGIGPVEPGELEMSLELQIVYGTVQ
jgi:uncharacterized protein YggE